MSDRLPSEDDWSAATRAGEAAEGGTPAGPPALAGAALAAGLLQAIVDAARDDAPNETVGLLIAPASAADGGRPTRYVRMANAAASPYRYLIDAQEQLALMLELEESHEVIWAIVHSHVASAAVPSATDVGLGFYPDSLYLICSLAGEVPEVRAWSIRDGDVQPVPLAVG